MRFRLDDERRRPWNFGRKSLAKMKREVYGPRDEERNKRESDV